MTETRQFVIRRAFSVPLALLVALTLALLVVCVVQGQPVIKIVILAGLTVPLAILLVESATRRIEVSAERIRAVRLFRNKEIASAAVTSLETVRVRNRVFMTVMAGDDEYLILSNAYARFPDLVRALVAAVPEASVTEETRQLAADPPKRQADVAAVWLAVVAMAYILAYQFLR